MKRPVVTAVVLMMVFGYGVVGLRAGRRAHPRKVVEKVW